jgi:hypothetical protein
MNADQLKGKWMQFKGDRSFDKILGMLQVQYGGNCASLAQERYGEKKDELLEWGAGGNSGSSRTARRNRRADEKASNRET